MRKIYHTNQRNSIYKFTRGPPFMILKTIKFKIHRRKNGNINKTSKKPRDERF